MAAEALHSVLGDLFDTAASKKDARTVQRFLSSHFDLAAMSASVTAATALMSFDF